MKVYLVGPHSSWLGKDRNAMFDISNLYIMETFICTLGWMRPYINGTHPKAWNFMLDSGAFSYIGTGKKARKTVDWNDYLRRYADYILSAKVKLFFELDIDPVVGLPRVEQMRKELESRVQRPCIPVWHKARGLDYWQGMVKDYDYVSIGASGRHDSKWTRGKHGVAALRKLVDIAHNNNCQVHGLGYTKLFDDDWFDGRPRFDSVDSASWSWGNQGGFLSRFNGKRIDKIDKPVGTRLRSREVHLYNWLEWVKFQQYADHAL